MPRVITSEQAPVVDAPLFRRVMGRFAINILGAGQQEIATHFAGRSLPAFALEFLYVGGIPTLGTVANVITGQTVATHECGDHSIFVGQILTMSADDSPPLVYHAGRFGALASGA